MSLQQYTKLTIMPLSEVTPEIWTELSAPSPCDVLRLESAICLRGQLEAAKFSWKRYPAISSWRSVAIYVQ